MRRIYKRLLVTGGLLGLAFALLTSHISIQHNTQESHCRYDLPHPFFKSQGEPCTPRWDVLTAQFANDFLVVFGFFMLIALFLTVGYLLHNGLGNLPWSKRNGQKPILNDSIKQRKSLNFLN